MDTIRQVMSIPIFLVLSGIIIAIAYAFWTWFRVYSTRYNLPQGRTRMIQTVVIGLLIIQIIFLFIVLNPLYNGIFVIICVFLGYTALRNIIAGIVLQATNTFENNEEYTVANHRGILTDVKLLGIELEENNKSFFVPYSLVTQRGMQKTMYSTMIRMIVKGMLPKEDNGELLNELSSKILMLPYVKVDKPYRIEKDQNITTFDLWLDQKEYEKPFIQFLENNQIVIIKE